MTTYWTAKVRFYYIDENGTSHLVKTCQSSSTTKGKTFSFKRPGEPSRAGATFVGWGDKHLSAGGTFTNNATHSSVDEYVIDSYAYWNFNFEFKVTYDFNGGYGVGLRSGTHYYGPLSLTCAEPDTAIDFKTTISDNEVQHIPIPYSTGWDFIDLMKRGSSSSEEFTDEEKLTYKATTTSYTFAGWDKEGQSVRTVTTTYAQWNASTSYSYRYYNRLRCYDGDTLLSQEEHYTTSPDVGNQYTIPWVPAQEKPGYIFKGWTKVKGSNVPNYQPGDSITITYQNLNLYAVYIPKVSTGIYVNDTINRIYVGEDRIIKAYVGNTKVFEDRGNPAILKRVGGRIFYDDGDNGATYTFYDAREQVITTHSISALANAVWYTVKGTPTKDRFYVYDNTSHKYGDVDITNGVSARELKWGYYRTSTGVTANTIGSGKTNTQTILNMGVPTDYTPNIWGYIKDCRDNKLNKCDDWFVASEVEQDKLRESGLVTWYNKSGDKHMWSSVEDTSSSLPYYACYWRGSSWYYDGKGSKGCTAAFRAF